MQYDPVHVIVIYGLYPYPHLVRDGWTRRIRDIDEIFKDRRRTYVWPVASKWLPNPDDYRVQPHRIDDLVEFVPLQLGLSNNARRLARLVDEAEFVYAHTGHSVRHLLPFYDTGKIITDLHGLSPEEEEMQGHPNRAGYFGAIEETMVRHSARLVAVSESMAEHFRAKYPNLQTPFTLLPILHEARDEPPARRESERLHVIYSGGSQRWQNVDRMLSTIAATRDHHRFSLWTGDVDAFRNKLAAHQLSDVDVRSLAPDELLRAYEGADLGFVLRDDSPVNRVSCPTKLSEYLASGIVPIVDLVEIGDFARLGYRYVTHDDFLAGNLPNHDELETMRRDNRRIFAKVHARYAAGADTLRGLSAPPATGTSRWVDHCFPLDGMHVLVRRDDGTHRVPLHDVADADVDLRVAIPGRGPIRDLRVCNGDEPLVLANARVELLSGNHRSELEFADSGRKNAFGDLCLRTPNDQLAAVIDMPLDADELRFTCEIALVGPEVRAALDEQPELAPELPWTRRALAGMRRILSRRDTTG